MARNKKAKKHAKRRLMPKARRDIHTCTERNAVL